jgi:hypothetical protein
MAAMISKFGEAAQASGARIVCFRVASTPFLPAIAVRKLGPPPYPASQDNKLMPKRRILRFKPALRLEW